MIVLDGTLETYVEGKTDIAEKVQSSFTLRIRCTAPGILVPYQLDTTFSSCAATPLKAAGDSGAGIRKKYWPSISGPTGVSRKR